jgi:transcriptional regulator with XRE-family HTH domain
MPSGVPSRIQVGARTYTLREIADGTGLSTSLVCLIFNQKRPITPYAATRLTSFFRISIEELFTPGTITVHTPPVRRPLGRIVYIRHRSH